MHTNHYPDWRNLLDDIVAYMNYLRDELDLQITLHGMESYLQPCLDQLLKYNLHSNSLCTYAKQSFPLWKHCIDRQYKVLNRAQDGMYFGMCWAGISEYILPVRNGQGQAIMFLSVSGYAVDEPLAMQRMKYVSRKYGLQYEQMLHIFQNILKHNVPSSERIRTLVQPLSRMLTLLHQCVYETTRFQESSDSNQLFVQAIQYIDRYYASGISLEAISGALNCSPSHLSHLFNRKVGCSLPAYVNQKRIEIAKQFLASTQMSVQEITHALGYNDANYFSTIFRRKCGVSPRNWRKNNLMNGEMDDSIPTE